MTDRDVMIQYLWLKVREEDWHGVADAAMDLRDIDSEHAGFQKAIQTQPHRKVDQP